MILGKEGSIPEVLKHKLTQGLGEFTYTHWYINFRLQSQHIKMSDLDCPQTVTRTTFKAHAHFSSQHLLIKLSDVDEYGVS